ncbi:MAG: HigA family addiction module antitoxin [Bryobacterales bacterium]|nr:HigA family addiction module antitoxin [Bryobacterales bacterium]MDE0295627.1 HigA family addiction module antitoxin [Bryobacterales bacterium]MDE0435457.1 HigA family addiction module antitoxin [Bryobacterales bacterium]
MAGNRKRRPTHPGRLLRDEIEARELNQGQVADLVGVGRRTINEICQGRRSMSTDMAHRIGKLFGNGPTLWVNMQKAVDMWDAEREHRADYAKIQTLEIAR